MEDLGRVAVRVSRIVRRGLWSLKRLIVIDSKTITCSGFRCLSCALRLCHWPWTFRVVSRWRLGLVWCTLWTSGASPAWRAGSILDNESFCYRCITDGANSSSLSCSDPESSPFFLRKSRQLSSLNRWCRVTGVVNYLWIMQRTCQVVLRLPAEEVPR